MFPYLDGSYYVAVIIAQALCVAHALKTGRRDWIYLLIFLPVVGVLLYIVREILPEINSGVFFVNLQRLLFPGMKVNELERRIRISDTDANRLNLAREYSLQQQPQKALELAKSCLAGIYENDLGIMTDVAKYACQAGDYQQSVHYFEKARLLKTANIEKPEDELLYAQALEGSGNEAKAEEEYQRIIRLHHHLEARYLYGLLLKKQGRTDEARKQFQSIQDEKSLHPRYVRRMHASVIRKSRREMRELR